MRFLVGALPEAKNWFQKQFFNQKLYIYFSKKKLSILSKKGGYKRDFPLYFQNVIWPEYGLLAKKNLKL